MPETLADQAAQLSVDCVEGVPPTFAQLGRDR
jgi:hypothetical protein